MPLDIAAIPGAAGLAAAGAVYIGLSMWGTGPLIGERMIERSGWTAECTRGLSVADSPAGASGDMGGQCQVLLGMMFGREGSGFCRRYGHELKALGEVLGSTPSSRLRSDPQSRCACAASVVLESRRIEFAVHAGSLRLVTPLPVRALRSELAQALGSSACQRKLS